MAISSTRNAAPHRWLYLPDGWDATWQAAKSASATTPAYVSVVGDSNAQGFQTAQHMTQAFPYLLRNALVAKYGSYGDYYTVANSVQYLASIGAGALPNGMTVPWTFDSTFGGDTAWGLGPQIMQLSGTFPQAWVNAGSGAFTTPYACTAFDVIYHDWNTTGTWKYSVDDAAGANLVTVTNDGRNSMRRLSVTGLSNAVHTVRFGAGSVQYALALNGIATYNPATSNRGIGFANISMAAAKAYQWLSSNSGMPDDRIRQLQGRYKTSTSVTSETGFGFPTQPHLAIIQLGINDCQDSFGLVQFRSALRRFCDAFRRGRDNASILFIICANPVPSSTDATAQWTRAESWSLYASQMYEIAAEYQCAVANFHADWMATPVAQGLITAADPHPTTAGHQAIANVLTSVLV